MSAPVSLAADFPAPEPERWRALAQKALGAATWDMLTARTADGVAIAPLYTAEHAPQGRAIGRAGPWDIRQLVEQADPGRLNAEILDELNGGATSIELRIAQAGGRGAQLRNADDLARALDGVMMDMAPVALDSGDDAAPARWLAAYGAKRGAKDAPLAFNLDPFAALLAGRAPPMDAALALTKEIGGDFPNATIMRVDARPVHEAGGGEAQELAYAIAVGIAYLRAGETAGLAPDVTAQSTLFALATGPDVVVEIAKLRAARLLWARALSACGAAAPMRLHAFTGRRMMTQRDAWTNILRVTAATFAAGVGGADCITTAPLTEAWGQPTPFARRLARNTQILLQEEAGLAHVTDPGAGSWAIEALTDEFARAAWTLFQDIEKRGGIVRALDWFSSEVAKTCTARLDAARDKTSPIVGVTVFPPTDDKGFGIAPWPEAKPPIVFAAIRLAEAFEGAAP